MTMTSKNFASVLLVICLCLIVAMVAYSGGGVRHLGSPNALLLLAALSFPFLVLWAAAKWAQGKAVPRAAIALSITFILLDAMVIIGPGSGLGDTSSSIVVAIVASLEMILPLTMVVCAIVSCARGDDKRSNTSS